MKQPNSFQQLKNYDNARPGIPGEHWLTFGAGLAVWWLSRRHPSVGVRTVGMLASTVLVGRATSGRDGIAKVFRLLSIGQSRRPQT